MGKLAGMVAVVLAAFMIVGAVWGACRPAVLVSIDADGNMQMDASDNVSFTAFGMFVILTAILGIIVATWAFIRFPEYRGAWMLFFVGLVSSAGAVGLWATSEFVVQMLHPLPAHDALTPGAIVDLVPALSPHVAFLTAPLTSTLSYWISLINDAEVVSYNRVPHCDFV